MGLIVFRFALHAFSPRERLAGRLGGLVIAGRTTPLDPFPQPGQPVVRVLQVSRFMLLCHLGSLPRPPGFVRER